MSSGIHRRVGVKWIDIEALKNRVIHNGYPSASVGLEVAKAEIVVVNLRSRNVGTHSRPGRSPETKHYLPKIA